MNAKRNARRLLRIADRHLERQEFSAATRTYRQAAALTRERPVLLRLHATILRQLGWTELLQGRYRSAQRTLDQAVAISERAHGAASVPVAQALNLLGMVFKYQARFSDAGPLYQRALDILEQRVGHHHPEVAALYHNLGGLEHAAGNWQRGEPFAREGLRIRRRISGPHHVDTAGDMAGLAALLDPQKKYAESERLYRQAIAIYERTGSPDDRGLVVCLNNLAAVHQARGRPRQAETLYRRALDLETRIFGPAHPKAGYIVANLAALLLKRGRVHDAESCSRDAIRILTAALGPHHPSLAAPMETLAEVRRRTRRISESAKYARRAETISASVPAVNDDGVGATATVNPMIARFRLHVAKSPVHRFGVFADEPIPAGCPVIEYTGERIARRESLRRWDPKRSYIFRVDSYWSVDGAIGGSGAEIINHSCEPNTLARLVRGRIYYWSKRRISRGEELTVDYKYEADIEPIPCCCGAPTCRGMMNRPRQVATRNR